MMGGMGRHRVGCLRSEATKMELLRVMFGGTTVCAAWELALVPAYF